MDRTALSKRLEGLSQVFADSNPMARDLKAMSYVLANMSDEKFANILNAGYTPDEDDKVAFGPRGMQPVPQSPGSHTLQSLRSPVAPTSPERGKAFLEEIVKAKPGAMETLFNMDESEILNAIRSLKQKAPAPAAAPAGARTATEETEIEGAFWSREASDAVRKYLVGDVVGKEAMNKMQCCDTKMHLTKDQTPDGEHKQSTPASLKPEQVPHIDESLDSNIVAESKKAPVKKEAGSIKGPGKPDGTGPHGGTEKCQLCEKKEDDKEDDKEAAVEKDTKEEKEEKDASVVSAEGVELTAPMQEIELSDDEAAKLSSLFSE